MAAIFFDGFNANRPKNNAYYGLETPASPNFPFQRIFGSTEKARNPSAPNAGSLKLAAVGYKNFLIGDGQGGFIQSSVPVGPAVRCVFGTQSGKKLFFGVAISGLQLHPTTGEYVSGESIAAPTHPTPENNAHTFLRVYGSNGTDRLDISVLSGSGPTVPLRLRLDGSVDRYAADTFDIFSDYIGTLQSETATISDLPTTRTQGFQVVRDPANNDFIYFEFALDLTNPAATTFECRINDQPLRLSASPEVESITLDNPLTNVAEIQLLSGVSGDVYYDDFYVADNTGSTVNDFLGRETAVYSPNLTATAEAAWDIVSDQSPADPTLNTIDDANYITTGGFDQVSTFAGSISPGATALVGAVMLTSYAKKTSLDAKYEHVYKPDGGTIQAVGTPKSVTNLSFSCPLDTLCTVPHTTIMPVNPVTNAQWTVNEINNDSFGVKSLDPAV